MGRYLHRFGLTLLAVALAMAIYATENPGYWWPSVYVGMAAMLVGLSGATLPERGR